MSTNTPNFNLEKPSTEEFYDVNVPNGNMDIIDDALATHWSESASEAHGQIRKEYMLFDGALTKGSANLTMPDGFKTLNDFDEVNIMGTMDTSSSATWKHFSQHLVIKNVHDTFGFSETHEVLFTSAPSDIFWLRGTLNKITNTVTISYNRRKLGTGNGEDVTINAIGGIVR
ncbi:hypothetical protein ACMGD3_13265 [Lysinibacillus sphaericus]|uniref:hypothetical protein n=1 Tax=Lysinibacillus sphaericus TaxID=1421 RepID=UPI003F795518